MAIAVGGEGLYLLVGLLAVAVLVAVAVGSALRSTRRELRAARARLEVLVDPCDDPVAVRLKCLERQLARLPPTVRRGGRRP